MAHAAMHASDDAHPPARVLQHVCVVAANCAKGDTVAEHRPSLSRNMLARVSALLSSSGVVR